MRVAEAAVAAQRQPRPVARLGEVGQQRLVVLGEDLRARRHLQRDVVAAGAGAVRARAVFAAPGFEMLLIAEVDQRVEIVHTLRPDVAALAAVTAVGAAVFDELFTPERDAAIAAVAGEDVDLGLIEEFHGSNNWGLLARSGTIRPPRRSVSDAAGVASLMVGYHFGIPQPGLSGPALVLPAADHWGMSGGTPSGILY